MATRTQAALYLAMDGLDVRPGKALLREAGLEVFDVADTPPATGDLERVVALLVGYDDVGDEWFDRLPALQVVATHSAGLDMIDVVAAKCRGIHVANLPGGATQEVAFHALAMALALIRRLPQLDRAVRRGALAPKVADIPALPSDLTCGVIGMGRIGRAFASLASGLFGTVVGHDPTLPDQSWPAAVERLPLAELLARSHCASLHLSLTSETRGIIDESALKLMPRGAVLVNVARGQLVDEIALAAALRSGQLYGAACDVFAEEPPPRDHPLLGEERALLSPHAAYLSPGSLLRYAERPARSVLAVLRDEDPSRVAEREPRRE